MNELSFLIMKTYKVTLLFHCDFSEHLRWICVPK